MYTSFINNFFFLEHPCDCNNLGITEADVYLIILSADSKSEMEHARTDEEKREIQAVYGERHIGRRALRHGLRRVT